MSEHTENDSLGDFRGLVNKLKAFLQEGGPDVDHDLLFAYLNGDLSPDQHQVVRRAIYQWRTWNADYWKMRAAFEGIDLAKCKNPDDDFDASISNTQLITQEKKQVRRALRWCIALAVLFLAISLYRILLHFLGE